jgi:3-hydroxyacyl-CoA dehydrogenase
MELQLVLCDDRPSVRSTHNESLGHVAVVGAGSIGVGWAVVFARAGLTVRLQDLHAGRLDLAAGDVRARLDALAEYGLLDEAPATVAARVTPCTGLAGAVAGARHVQECAPEDLPLKRDLFATLDGLLPAGIAIASSSSALVATEIAGRLHGRARCLVVHPGNPPYLLPVVEVVPAPFTDAGVVDRTVALLEDCGMAPVRLAMEIEGFVFNRLQGALLREAYFLVGDGVATVDDIDRVVRTGLGRRWAVLGPFETADLNTRGGIAEHAARLGPAYARMGAERGQDDPWTPELVAKVTAARRAALPLDRWDAAVERRDRTLMALERARRALDQEVTHGAR